MAWRFGGARGKAQPHDSDVPQETPLTGKSLEIAQEIVRKSLEADRVAIERYSIIPPAFPGTK